MISRSADWVCYAGGVGVDVTFDLGIIDRFGCQVFAFDPTPRAIAYVADHAKEVKKFHFMPVGLWSEAATLRFYAARYPRSEELRVGKAWVSKCRSRGSPYP